MTAAPSAPAARSAAWLTALRRYFALVVPAHLAWEFAHVPLYTIWREGTAGEIAFAVVHCTGGDILIAMSTLVLALLVVGAGWPTDRRAFRRVTAFAITFGAGYTVFSEWLNVVVRAAWAYNELMPVVPIVDTGLTPLLQWIVIPAGGFWWAGRSVQARRSKASDT